MSTYTRLEICSSLAGLVIGRGGSNIKNMQNDSGAVIKLVNGETDDTRFVNIIGSAEAQSIAQDLVTKIVDGKVLRTDMVAAPKPPPRKQRLRDRSQSPFESFTVTQEQWNAICKENDNLVRDYIATLPQIVKVFYVEHRKMAALSDRDVDAIRLAKNNIMVKYVLTTNGYRAGPSYSTGPSDGTDPAKGTGPSDSTGPSGDAGPSDSTGHSGDAGPSNSTGPDDGTVPAVVLPPIPKPIMAFKHAFHVFPEIMDVIQQQNFNEPTPIQCQAWPCILSGHDVIAIAQTGTGKTLSYILPAIINLLRQPIPRKDRLGPYVLILGPTRELVLQIEDEVKKYIFDGIHVLSVYGGSDNSAQQITRLANERPDIVVATPGRLNDLVGQLGILLHHVTYLVLDEADRMLDMGFQNQIELALRHVRHDRQTILTSATWPESVRELSKKYTNNPIQIQIGSLDLVTVDTVRQEVIVLREHQKEAWLDNFIYNTVSKTDRVIIFMRTKSTVDRLYRKYRANNVECRYALVLIIIEQPTKHV